MAVVHQNYYYGIAVWILCAVHAYKPGAVTGHLQSQFTIPLQQSEAHGSYIRQ